MLVDLLGELRPYKNLAVLQDLPPTDTCGRLLRIVVAGTFHASCNIDQIETVFRTINTRRRVRIEKHLSDERRSELIQSVDIIFMPYLRGRNSGFAMFALACGGDYFALLCQFFAKLRLGDADRHGGAD